MWTRFPEIRKGPCFSSTSILNEMRMPPCPCPRHPPPPPKKKVPFVAFLLFHECPPSTFGSALTEFPELSSTTRSRYRFWTDDPPEVGIPWAGTRRSSQFSGNPTSSTKQQDLCGWSASNNRAQDCWWNNKEQHTQGRFERKCGHGMWSCRTKKMESFCSAVLGLLTSCGPSDDPVQMYVGFSVRWVFFTIITSSNRAPPTPSHNATGTGVHYFKLCGGGRQESRKCRSFVLRCRQLVFLRPSVWYRPEKYKQRRPPGERYSRTHRAQRSYVFRFLYRVNPIYWLIRIDDEYRRTTPCRRAVIVLRYSSCIRASSM